MERPRQILYVDDDAGLRRLVSRALSRRGYDVTTAENAEEALRLIEEGEFDLVAVDHYMPGKDGLALLAEITAMDDAPPVVFVTGTSETRVAVEALKSGAADFVVKAVGDDFFDLLNSAFEQAFVRVALRRAKEGAEQDLREANARLETLLGEVHHRVANSLQLVSTFVSMQGSQAQHPDVTFALEETLRRIRAVSQVHRSLYTSSDSEFVELDAYLKTLVDALRTGQSDLTLEYSAESVRVKPDQAVSIGVLVTELVSNAVKYAYPEGSEGSIHVEVKRLEGDKFSVEVYDDGAGFEDGGVQGTGLGMRIVNAMAHDLRSELRRVPRERGTHFALEVVA